MSVPTLRLVVAGTPHEHQQVAALRDARYRRRFPDAEPWWLDDERDRLGHVFLLTCMDEPVATARVMPVSCRCTELEQMERLPEAALGDSTAFELGRVAAVRPSVGPALPYASLLFFWAAGWAELNAGVGVVFAYCRRAKLAGFVTAGADVVEGPYLVPGKGEDYFTVRAYAADVVDRARQLGLGGLLAAASASRDVVRLDELHGTGEHDGHDSRSVPQRQAGVFDAPTEPVALHAVPTNREEARCRCAAGAPASLAPSCSRESTSCSTG